MCMSVSACLFFHQSVWGYVSARFGSHHFSQCFLLSTDYILVRKDVEAEQTLRVRVSGDTLTTVTHGLLPARTYRFTVQPRFRHTSGPHSTPVDYVVPKELLEDEVRWSGTGQDNFSEMRWKWWHKKETIRSQSEKSPGTLETLERKYFEWFDISLYCHTSGTCMFNASGLYCPRRTAKGWRSLVKSDARSSYFMM